MTTRVFDIEANGLENVTQVWCYVSQDVETEGMVQTDYGEYSMIQRIQLDLDHTDLLIGHNIIGYDLPVLEEVLGITYRGEVFDTLIMSRLLNPDRAGGHSLAAWGEKLGYPKVEHEEWDRYSPEMLHRCKEDVSLNVLVYKALLKEMEKK